MRSSARKLHNDIETLEISSDKFVESSSCYIIKVKLENNNKPYELCKEFLVKRIEEMPSCGYVYDDTIYLLFSQAEKNHMFDGSHHRLCSHFCSRACIFSSGHVVVSLIELATRQAVLAYFQSKTFENTVNSIQVLSKGKITQKEATSLTMTECVNLFEERTKEKWGDIASSERHGIFIKYTDCKFIKMSEIVDARNMDRYLNYIFGK